MDATEPRLPLRLDASRLKWARLLGVALLFVLGGLWIVPRDAASEKLRTLSVSLAGGAAALPDTYGKSAAELIALLEKCRAQYANTDRRV